MAQHIPLVDIVAQYSTIKEDIDSAIADVITSGSFIRGSALTEFENSFAKMLGGGFAIGLGSGTEALHMATRACGIGPDDEVITVPNTWISTAFSASYVGARPVFVDIDPRTYQMDVMQLEGAITTKTRAILPVHMFGHPAPMIEIMDLAKQHNLWVIEDVAQAPLAKIEGQIVGTIGDVGCFSFYPSKNLGCYGDGGAIFSKDSDITERIRVDANYGQVEPFKHIKIGSNSRLDTLQAAILNVKLPYLPSWTIRRREIANAYKQLLDEERISLPHEASGVEPVYHLFVIQIDKRDECVAFLRDRGVMAQIHYPTTVHTQECYKLLGYTLGDFPIAERLSNHGLSLPIYPEMSDAQIEYVTETVNLFAK